METFVKQNSKNSNVSNSTLQSILTKLDGGSPKDHNDNTKSRNSTPRHRSGKAGGSQSNSAHLQNSTNDSKAQSTYIDPLCILYNQAFIVANIVSVEQTSPQYPQTHLKTKVKTSTSDHSSPPKNNAEIDRIQSSKKATENEGEILGRKTSAGHWNCATLHTYNPHSAIGKASNNPMMSSALYTEHAAQQAAHRKGSLYNEMNSLMQQKNHHIENHIPPSNRLHSYMETGVTLYEVHRHRFQKKYYRELISITHNISECTAIQLKALENMFVFDCTGNDYRVIDDEYDHIGIVSDCNISWKGVLRIILYYRYYP
jgi:hypothetical protein